MFCDLKGKRGIVFGISNEQSIAYSCAKIFASAGADLAITYLNERIQPNIENIAKELKVDTTLKCDVTAAGELENVFAEIAKKWGKLDFLLHSLAFAPRDDLANSVCQCSRDGFSQAMLVSCYSFIEMARLASPIMNDGGSLLTVSYYGSNKVVPNYNIMGVVKAALESATRYLAVDLGSKNIRVNAISPGPIMTKAASKIQNFSGILQKAEDKSALHRLVDVEGVGNLATFLVSNGAKDITGQILYIDAGDSIMA